VAGLQIRLLFAREQHFVGSGGNPGRRQRFAPESGDRDQLRRQGERFAIELNTLKDRASIQPWSNASLFS